MAVIETASEFYREIKSRGLELRKNNGRDDALYSELLHRLNCPQSDSLQAFLDTSSLSAEDFLKEFLEIAAPFAVMFQDIWKFLSTVRAPKAKEEIRIRFGFDTSIVDIDLDQFREYAEVAADLEGLSGSTWSENAHSALFDMAEMLRDSKTNLLEDDWRGYDPEVHHDLPEIVDGGHPCDKIASEIRSHLHDLDSMVREDQVKESGSPEARITQYYLSDILPCWHSLFASWSEINDEKKDAALDFFERTIAPLLEESRRDMIQQALDILNLPFWEHRWHTYEIWVTVQTLRMLERFLPVPRIENGYIALDTQSSQVIAELCVENHEAACVIAQMQTPFESGTRKAIKPDLSICYDNNQQPESRAAIIEIKQRKSLSASHLSEVTTSYRDGSPKAAGVIIVNYDSDGELSEPIERVTVFTDVRPQQGDSISALESALNELLFEAKLEPLIRTFVLLDVSGSMAGEYDEQETQKNLITLLQRRGTTGFRFSEKLIDLVGLPSGDDFPTETFGGTDLSKSLDELYQQHGCPDYLIVVSDSGFGHDERVSDAETCFVCTPSHILDAIRWRSNKSTSITSPML